MNKYQEKIIYSGNIVNCINGEKIILKENVYLVYDSVRDTFYSLDDTLNYSLDYDLNENLSSETREEYQNKIQEYNYPYSISQDIKGPYIDESSIVVAIPAYNRKK